MFKSSTKAADESLSRAKAEQMLMNELLYSKERAQYIIKQFDKNGDGKLNGKELEKFKRTVKQTKKELMDLFTSIDQQKVGYISIEDATAFLQKPPFDFPIEKVKALLARFDKDGKGKLFYNEFVALYPEAKAAQEETAQCFAQLDVDANGHLSPEELTNAIQMTTGYDEHNARQFIASFDMNGDGFIDKSEFTTMWTLMFG